ncbi:MAG: extracellular solute-binding protein [Spirochaetaceae bacterium]|jgi:microcin C transport system substrate-binding protein|nr:extracellular solute-binding protein [Spirochaetaceae bacterium]
MRKIFILCCFAVCTPLVLAQEGRAQNLQSSTFLALRGEPLCSGAWTHLRYANPDAPKGGSMILAAIGTYDNFHRYALRGISAEGTAYFYDTLMQATKDEVDVLYPLIAERVEYPGSYAYFIFHLNPRAKNQKGEAITAHDVVFSFSLFYEKGVPQFRAKYKDVVVEALDDRRVRYTIPQKFDEFGKPAVDTRGNPVHDKDMMISLATLPVMPASFWEGRNFSEPLIEPPEGTGPYRVKEYKIGHYVVYERVKDYWAADLPVNKGRYNFDFVRFDYYRDSNVAFEAFKSGEYDFRFETSPKNWATGYTGAVFDSGRVVREEIPNQLAQPMRAFVFNTERTLFSDRRIRAALQYFFDFEWMNKQLLYSTYKRTRSYFQNTEYEAHELPDADERAALAPVRDKIPAEVFTAEYNPPVTSGDGYIRAQAREGLKLLRDAGWELKNGVLVNKKGERFSFELLLYNVDMERIAVAYQRNLARYGIDMRIRLIVDTTQVSNRLQNRDFDMIVSGYYANQTPSSSLMIVWHSKHIDSTWNTAGVRDPAIDYLTQAIADAQEDENRLLVLGRALDRVLTWNFYVIPLWNLSAFRIAYSSKFMMPSERPRYDLDTDTWWVKQ